MTPSARYAAAIEVLDAISNGQAAEKALLAWARSSRFAGSKDRAAVRDHVFDVLRKKRACAAYGGGASGRSLVLGYLKLKGDNPADVFDGSVYGPSKMTPAEQAIFEQKPELTLAETYNLPDDIWDLWCASLQDDAVQAARLACERGPVTLRTVTKRSARDAVIKSLSKEDIGAEPHPECPTAIIVTQHERRLKNSSAFRDGLFEFQDASSQLAIGALEIECGAKVLDYCAGGGGKSLALADLHGASVTAHDIAFDRMKDLPDRASRTGQVIDIVKSATELPVNGFDLVFVDAPCSGSGTWRRTPDQKWAMTVEKVDDFRALQLEVLSASARFVAKGGQLCYATCSVFKEENQSVVGDFLRSSGDWTLVSEHLFSLSSISDGFYLAQLRRV